MGFICELPIAGSALCAWPIQGRFESEKYSANPRDGLWIRGCRTDAIRHASVRNASHPPKPALPIALGEVGDPLGLETLDQLAQPFHGLLQRARGNPFL